MSICKLWRTPSQLAVYAIASSVWSHSLGCTTLCTLCGEVTWIVMEQELMALTPQCHQALLGLCMRYVLASERAIQLYLFYPVATYCCTLWKMAALIVHCSKLTYSQIIITNHYLHHHHCHYHHHCHHYHHRQSVSHLLKSVGVTGKVLYVWLMSQLL